ncbi:uncharacterized protein LOC117785480 [Drosophila innubila]|uniref:uncharacterized protein LOC117785480 n=1 Tax=Drosophila innubila TaxID=198719 RepID=UPI00148B4D87|nr:uncharacterized protein LOC117785480 [Drosophila innubila]
MACRCKYFVKLLNKCCFCFTLRTGTLLLGCIFLTWFVYLCLGSAFMMECIFPNEYQHGVKDGAPAAPKTTMVFSFFGIIAAAMVCIGVHNNNELLFVPFLTLAPFYIIVHIVAMILYSFVWIIIVLFVITIVVLIYAWVVIYSYFTELRYAYEDELPQQTFI